MGCLFGKTARHERRVKKGYKKLDKKTQSKIAEWDRKANLTRRILDNTENELKQNRTLLESKEKELQKLEDTIRQTPPNDKARLVALLGEKKALEIQANRIHITLLKQQNLLNRAKLNMDGELFEIAYEREQGNEMVLAEIWKSNRDHGEFIDDFVEGVQESDFALKEQLGEQEEALAQVDTTLELESLYGSFNVQTSTSFPLETRRETSNGTRNRLQASASVGRTRDSHSLPPSEDVSRQNSKVRKSYQRERIMENTVS